MVFLRYLYIVNGNIIKYILKVWLTSGILCPIVMMVLLAALPNYRMPELIGFICIIYIFPCTLLLSVINLIVNMVILMGIAKGHANEKSIKLILSVVSLLTTCITILVIYNIHVFSYLDIGFDYILPVSYIIALISALFFYKLIVNPHSTIIAD
jgi:hypothetical protein